jgi:leucyl/phenylalanyl-tRNA--protein transferase
MRRPVWLRENDPPSAMPSAEEALTHPEGLVAIGGALSPVWLVHAYRHGIFPWYSVGQPILWWSPDPRAVLFPAEFRRSRSLGQSIRNRGYETRLDTAYARVIDACAAPRTRDGGTWITAEMRAAYLALHDAGLALSVETWRDGELVGGLYGVALGRVFFGESMFARARDASKVALARLVDECRARGVDLIDCQMATSHLASLGSRLIPRREFVAQVGVLADPAIRLWCRGDGQL